MHDFTVGTASKHSPDTAQQGTRVVHYKGEPMTLTEDQMTRIFWNKISQSVRGCWEWVGSTLPIGYGRMHVAGTYLYAHRVSYEIHKGPIGDGLHIDHLCRNRVCCNPEHLEAVTCRENILRSPIAPAGVNAAKTHCNYGHEYTPENTVLVDGGRARSCRICRRWHERRVEAKKRGLPLPAAPGQRAPRQVSDFCSNGHPYDEANTYIQSSGKRRCRACARAASARQNAKRRAAAATVPPPRDSEPEPQHDRAEDNPDQLPPLPRRVPRESL